MLKITADTITNKGISAEIQIEGDATEVLTEITAVLCGALNSITEEMSTVQRTAIIQTLITNVYKNLMEETDNE